jgi:hypothetical protein
LFYSRAISVSGLVAAGFISYWIGARNIPWFLLAVLIFLPLNAVLLVVMVTRLPPMLQRADSDNVI